MKYFANILIILIFLFLNSCSNDKKKIDIIEEDIELQMIESYKEGIKALESGDVLFAAKKFNEAELVYPQSDWAPKSALMSAYSYYIHDYSHKLFLIVSLLYHLAGQYNVLHIFDAYLLDI